eukprot:TRINITY_DN2788_c0_g1_i3.p1 TRINITY_DN2788_c0_g1~~TRINITY_DN2788_c0_g1_i3.p1  ORF type:complete len:390 (-),score=161.20 TRINITY_DN2788_c0_g1_i3:100-1269(-)
MEENRKTNDSFRDFLSTPRRDSSQNDSSHRFQLPNSRPKRRNEHENENKQSKKRTESNESSQHKHSSSERRHANPSPSSSSSSLGNGYRDRAKERREGLVENETLSELEMFSTTEENQRAKSSSLSSFPFLSSSQLSSQILSTQQEEENESESEEEGFEESEEKEEEVKVESELAKSLLNYFCSPKQKNAIETFLPARTSFVFQLKGKSEVPTILKRSKEDCPAVIESISFQLQNSITLKMNTIFDSVRELDGSLSNHRKKLKIDADKSKPQNQPTPTITTQQTVENKPPVDDDEDIFEDCGRDYVPQYTKETKENSTSSESTQMKHKTSVKNLFKEEERKIEEPTQSNNQILDVIKEQLQKKKKREKQMQVDDYSECYPGPEIKCCGG